MGVSLFSRRQQTKDGRTGSDISIGQIVEAERASAAMVLREQLTEMLQEQVGKGEVREVEELSESDIGTLSLLQWKLLTNIAKKQDITDEIEQEISWILNEKIILETLLCSGYIQNHRWLNAIQLLREIIDVDVEPKQDTSLDLL